MSKPKHAGNKNLSPLIQAVGAAFGAGNPTPAPTETGDDGADVASGVMTGNVAQAKPPSAWSNYFNPIGGQGYYNMQMQQLRNQGQLANTGLMNSGQLANIKQGGQNTLDAQNNANTLAFAQKYGIDPKMVPTLQEELYPTQESTAMGNATAGANVANNAASITGSKPFFNSQSLGMNAQEQLPAGQLAKDTAMTAGPGTITQESPNLLGVPNTLRGPTSMGTSDNTTSGMKTVIDPVTGKPTFQQFTNKATGNTFGGGGFQNGMPGTDLSDIYNKFMSLQNGSGGQVSGSNSPTGYQGSPDNDEDDMSGANMPPPVAQAKPMGAPTQAGGLSSLLYILQNLGQSGTQYKSPGVAY